MGCSGEPASGLALGSAEWSNLQCQILGSRVKFILGRDGSADDGRLGQDLRHFNRGLRTRNMHSAAASTIKPSTIAPPGWRRSAFGRRYVAANPFEIRCTSRVLEARLRVVQHAG